MPFPDYSTLVLLKYERLKKANNLPLGLLHPSPAKLKKLCMEICSRRFSKKDERVLDDFFGAGSEINLTLKAIKRCEINKFKSLVNFIQRRTSSPDEKIVELLAWMIDFQPRPFDYLSDYTVPNENEEIGVNIVEPDLPKSENEQVGQLPGSTTPPIVALVASNMKKRASLYKLKNSLLAALLLVLLAGAIYWSMKRSAMAGNRQCMYWSNDRYEPIDCSQKKEQVLLLALDTVKTKYFRRVTRPDTITYAAIGYLWYAKMSNDSIEFYTLPGVHPLDLQKKLRPITAYIIDKYVLKISPHP